MTPIPMNPNFVFPGSTVGKLPEAAAENCAIVEDDESTAWFRRGLKTARALVETTCPTEERDRKWLNRAWGVLKDLDRVEPVVPMDRFEAATERTDLESKMR